MWHSQVVVPSSASMPNAVPTVTHRPQAGHNRLSVFGRLLVPSPLAASPRISRRMLLMPSPPANGPCQPWGVSSHHGLASRFSARIRSARPGGRHSRSGGSVSPWSSQDNPRHGSASKSILAKSSHWSSSQSTRRPSR
jgi:hypothetical protein